LPSWVPPAVVIVIVIWIAALLLPALGKAGSFTSSYEIVARASGGNVPIHFDQFRPRPGGFYFAIPGFDAEQSATMLPAGTLKVFRKDKLISESKVTTICCEKARLHETNDMGRVSALLWLRFDGQRLPPALRAGQAYDFVFQLSTPLPTNTAVVQKYRHRPGASG
jgi:hypothetical protein